MKNVDSKEAVEGFLLKTHEILEAKDFNIYKNFQFLRFRTSYSDDNKHTNDETLVDLDYGVKDVVAEILSLTVENYKETIIDNQAGKIKPFYCFIKTIKGKQVYIKFKISEVKEKQIFCVSFHFAEFFVYDNQLPYKNNKK